MKILIAFFVSVCAAVAVGDTPANCTHGDVLGTWVITESQRGATSQENCTENFGSVARTFRVTLLEPNIVKDDLGRKGFWTVVYNQGFEIIINNRKYFAFSYYKQHGKKVISYCGSTFPGWSHDILGKNWACYRGKKVSRTKPKVSFQKRHHNGFLLKRLIKQLDTYNLDLTKTWTSTVYPEFLNETFDNLLFRVGGSRSKVFGRPKTAEVTEEQVNIDKNLPESFDWRNVSGTNYISPIRNQGTCGSCYAFASMAILEARLRIVTRNKDKTIFSPQDVVGCSEYAQGCEGGFPYLIAGKYAQDFGVVPEQCFPYKGRDTKCTEHKCTRYYSANYNYVGGYYGACNEVLMKEALVKDGPIAVSFEVTPEFTTYKGGIFQSSGKLQHPGFEDTNHAVLVVGYGVQEKTGLKYWIVKNSWGSSWGEEGYFRIVRGRDELHLESMAVEANLIPY